MWLNYSITFTVLIGGHNLSRLNYRPHWRVNKQSTFYSEGQGPTNGPYNTKKLMICRSTMGVYFSVPMFFPRLMHKRIGPYRNRSMKYLLSSIILSLIDSNLLFVFCIVGSGVVLLFQLYTTHWVEKNVLTKLVCVSWVFGSLCFRGEGKDSWLTHLFTRRIGVVSWR